MVHHDTQTTWASCLPNSCALPLGQTAALLFSMGSNCRLLHWVTSEKWTSSCNQHKLGFTLTSLVSPSVNKLPCLKEGTSLTSSSPLSPFAESRARERFVFQSPLDVSHVCALQALSIYATPSIFKACYKVFSLLVLGTHRRGVITDMKKPSQRIYLDRWCWSCDYNLVVWGPKSHLFTPVSDYGIILLLSGTDLRCW